MFEKAKIEVLEVALDHAGLKTSRKVMSSQSLIDWIGETANGGSTGVVHLRNLPQAKVYLLMMADGNQAIFPMNGKSAAELTSAVQLFGFMLNSERAASSKQEAKAADNSAQQNQKSGTSNNQERRQAGNNGAEMTEAQRRYLFRLMAEKKNLKGKDAENFLKQEFEVVSLRDIDKLSASQYIDRLVKGGDGR